MLLIQTKNAIRVVLTFCVSGWHQWTPPTDVPCDDTILNHVGEAYRRFRNTLRFLLGEIEDQFDPAVDGVPFDELMPYDKLVLARMCQVHDQVGSAYEAYRFNQVYRTLYDYVIGDLSNGYLNATKDRVYCGERDGFERKSALTVLGSNSDDARARFAAHSRIHHR